MARSVADCALMQNVMSGPHPGDITTLKPTVRLPQKPRSIRGWKIASSVDLGYFEVDPEVAENHRRCEQLLKECGAIVEPVKLNWSNDCLTAAWDHLHHLWGGTMDAYYEQRDQMTDYGRDFVERSRGISTRQFIDSMMMEGRMYDELGAIMQQYQALICPTLALPAVSADHDPVRQPLQVNGVDIEPNIGWCMTYPFNMLSRCPVISLPSGRAANQVPTGIQVVGRTYEDANTFAIAAALESIRGDIGEPVIA